MVYRKMYIYKWSISPLLYFYTVTVKLQLVILNWKKHLIDNLAWALKLPSGNCLNKIHILLFFKFLVLFRILYIICVNTVRDHYQKKTHFCLILSFSENLSIEVFMKYFFSILGNCILMFTYHNNDKTPRKTMLISLLISSFWLIFYQISRGKKVYIICHLCRK